MVNLSEDEIRALKTERQRRWRKSRSDLIRVEFMVTTAERELLINTLSLSRGRIPFGPDEIRPEELKKLRERLDLSQTAMANLIGVSYSTYSRIEHGHNKPSPKTISAIIKVMQQSPG